MNELPLHCIVSTHTLDKKCTFSKVHCTSTPMRKYTRPTHNTTLLLRGWKWATLFARRIGKLGSLWCRPFRPRGSSALCYLWNFYWALVPATFSVRYKEHLWPWLLSAIFAIFSIADPNCVLVQSQALTSLPVLVPRSISPTWIRQVCLGSGTTLVQPRAESVFI